MATYVITDPRTGRELEIEANRPPTQADAARVFAENPEAAAEPQAPAAPEPEQPAQPKINQDLLSAASGAMTRGPIYFPDWAAKALLTKGGAVGDVAAGVVPAIAGAVAGSVAGPKGTAVGGALGSLGGDALMQARRMIRGDQDKFSAGQSVTSTALGALPLTKLGAMATPVKALTTRGVQGAVLGGGAELGSQVIDGKDLEWGSILFAGAVGTGLGAVMGVPEALKLRKVFGGKIPLEGKTLKEATEIIAAEQKIAPDVVQGRINEMVGVGKPADYFTKNASDSAQAFSPKFDNAIAEKSAQESAERILALEGVQAAQRAQQLDTSLKANQLGGAESVILSDDPLKNQLTAIETRPGASAKERARVEAKLEAQTPKVSDGSITARLSPQASRMADEYGRINPAALMPLAQAAAGGVIGSAIGDTPEDRIRNAAIGVGIGLSPDMAKKLAVMVKNTPVGKEVADAATLSYRNMRKTLNKAVYLPEPTARQLRLGEQATAAIDGLGQSRVRDMADAIEGSGDIAQVGLASASVNKYLHGEITLAALPAHLQATAGKVRAFIDDLSDRAVTEGVVTGQLAQTFLDNKKAGSYLRRSYEAFLAPNWRVDVAKRDTAVNALMANAVVQGFKMTKDEAVAGVAGLLQRVADARKTGNLDFVTGGGKIGGKDVSSLMRKHDLIPEIKDLLGEIQDPVISAGQSISRLARLVEMDAAQIKAREVGLKMGIFSTKQDFQFSKALVADSSDTHNQMRGLYADPDVADAFVKVVQGGHMGGLTGVVWDGIRTATSASKIAMTVLNPISWSPNLAGGVLMNAFNGNFRVSSVGRGLMLGAEELGVLRAAFPKYAGRESLQKELAELRKNGVLGESIIGDDLTKSLDRSLWGKLSDPATRLVQMPIKGYGAVDDFTRYVNYKSEVAKYTKAFPGMAQDEVNRRAGEVTRRTFPTASEVPVELREASVAGLSHPFVSWLYGVFRGTKNTFEIALGDIKEGIATNNPELKKIGAKRLAYAAGVLTASGSYGISKLSKDQNGITPEQEAAARAIMPEWNSGGVLQFHSKVGGGQKIVVSNQSYILPHSAIWEAYEAARKGAGPMESSLMFTRALFDQFVANPATDSIVLANLASAMQGFDTRNGRELPKTDTKPTVQDRAKWFAEKTFKPLFIDFAQQTAKAMRKEQGEYGRVYTLQEQANRLFGIRQSTYDPVVSMQWKTRELGQGLQDAAEIYTSRSSMNLPPEKSDEYYARSEEVRQKVFNEIGVFKKHAEVLGISQDQYIAMLREAKVPPVLIRGVIDGIYTPKERDKDSDPLGHINEQLKNVKSHDEAANLLKMYVKDGGNPFEAKAAANRYKANVRAKALGITPADGLLKSIAADPEVFYDYIGKKLLTLETTEERQRFYQNLEDKGILTPQIKYLFQNGKSSMKPKPDKR